MTPSRRHQAPHGGSSGSGAPSATTVGLLDPNRMVRDAYARAMKERAGLEVVLQCDDLDDMLSHDEGGNPGLGVILASRAYPDEQLLRMARALYTRAESARLVIMDMDPVESVILRFVEAGMTGYVLADQGMDETIQVLEAVGRGETVVSPRIARVMTDRIAELADLYLTDGFEVSYLSRLTAREAEVLEQMAQGLTNSEIGETLYITEGTVKTHVHHILRKLHVPGREEAARYYAVARVGLLLDGDE